LVRLLPSTFLAEHEHYRASAQRFQDKRELAMKIDKNKILITAATELRRHAEERLRTKTSELHQPRTEEVSQQFIHELEVHQIELEMQNAELLQARDEVETALDKYTDLYDFAPVGYFTLDCNAAISAVNLAGACLIGGVRSRLIGRLFGQFVTAKDRPAFTAFLGKVLNCRVKESCEVALLYKGNQPVIVQIEAMATASGQEFRLALIDITRRRGAEDALAENRRELVELKLSQEVRIVQAMSELRRKDQMLIRQDRMAMVDGLIDNTAHQWRQPLNTLGLIIPQFPLFYDSAEFSMESLGENTEKGTELIRRMVQTINDFKNFFRSDKELITFGVNQVIRQTVTLIKKRFEEQQISIVLQTEGDPMVSGYPNEYVQALLNILINARDALVEHDVADARISLNVFVEGGSTVVTVTDNAGGISKEIIDRVFDPYFTTKGPGKGAGIGLFMSKSIIEKNMGGQLTVRNTGYGAEFRINV
jgi:signal transduction histidine kinase